MDPKPRLFPSANPLSSLKPTFDAAFDYPPSDPDFNLLVYSDVPEYYRKYPYPLLSLHNPTSSSHHPNEGSLRTIPIQALDYAPTHVAFPNHTSPHYPTDGSPYPHHASLSPLLYIPPLTLSQFRTSLAPYADGSSKLPWHVLRWSTVLAYEESDVSSSAETSGWSPPEPMDARSYKQYRKDCIHAAVCCLYGSAPEPAGRGEGSWPEVR